MLRLNLLRKKKPKIYRRHMEDDNWQQLARICENLRVESKEMQEYNLFGESRDLRAW